MSSNYTTNLKNKRVISVTGDESEVFLNNIITNDIKKIKKKKQYTLAYYLHKVKL